MRIGAAILERDHLNTHLDALKSRLLADNAAGRPLTHVLEEIEQTAQRLFALRDAIDWTFQHLAVSKKPLGAYLNRTKHLQKMVDVLETATSPELRTKVDQLREAKKATEVLLQTIYWAYDLQIPEAAMAVGPDEEEG